MGVLAAFRNAQLARVLACFGVWIAADWAMLVTLSVVAYGLGGSGAVGVIGAARVLPAAVFGPLVSMAADRLRRPLVLAVTHAVMAGVASVLAVVESAGASLAVLAVVVAVGAVLSAAFKPCLNALVPQVVRTPEELVAANAAYGSVEAGATVLGPVLSGVLVETVPASTTFVVLAVMYALAAAATTTIRTAFQPSRSRARSGWPAVLEPLRGFPLMAARPGVRVVFWTIMAQTVMRGLLNVFVVVLAARVAGTVAGLFAAVGAGGLVGAQLAVRLGGEARAARRTAIGVALWGVPVLAIGGWPAAGVVWVGLLVIGVGNALEDVYGYSLLNRLTPDEVAGRAWGAFHAIGAASVAAGSLLAPVLVHLLGLRGAMALTGALLVSVPLVMWPRLRALDRASVVRPEAVALLRGVPALAPLPLLALERLARGASDLAVADGTRLIAEGEAGDRFYVIEDGLAQVTQHGRTIRELGPGDSFGEIALLRGVARTATVTSAGPLRVLAVDVGSFVAAVTGHRDTATVAEDTVRTLLAGDEGR